MRCSSLVVGFGAFWYWLRLLLICFRLGSLWGERPRLSNFSKDEVCLRTAAYLGPTLFT